MLKVYENERKITLYGDVTEKVGKQVHKALLKFKKSNPTEPVHFYINSGGGDVPAMRLMIKDMENMQVYTYNTKRCASAAFEMWLAGKKRYMYKDSKFMYHNAVGDFNGCDPLTIEEIKEAVEYFEEETRISEKFVVKKTKTPIEIWKKHAKGGKEWWLSASSVVKYGWGTIIKRR